MTDLVEKVAREIAENLGDQFGDALLSKSDWVARRGEGYVTGRFRDVNEPYRCDYLNAAQAVIPLIVEECAKVADEWLRSDFDESANTMAANIADDIRALRHLAQGAR